MTETNVADQLQLQLYSLLVSKEILEYFEITKVKEQTSDVTIELTEKPELIPEKLKGKEAVLNGYLHELEQP